MEVVQNFNKELKTLLDHRPPVSRQKMSMITKSAMRGLKFYKHVVQSVEKFIQKCNVDYKVPGLYVVDAIIRQSRHQYGADRDVFAPRFLKNLLLTFQHLYQCDEKDRPLIVRVLNLWLKGEVFPGNVIHALIDMANAPLDPRKLRLAQQTIFTTLTDNLQKKGLDASDVSVPMLNVSAIPAAEDMYQPEENVDLDHEDTDNAAANDGGGAGGGLISSIAALLQRFADGSGQDTSHYVERLQILHKQVVEQSSRIAQGEMIDQEVLAELHSIMLDLQRVACDAYTKQQSLQAETRRRTLAAKAVLDYDYDDSDEEAEANEAELPDQGQGIEPDLLEQLAQMTDTLAQTQALQEELRQARLQAAAQTTQEQPMEVWQAPAASSPPQQRPLGPTGVQVFDYGHQGHQSSGRQGDLEEGEVAEESAEFNNSFNENKEGGFHRDRDYRSENRGHHDPRSQAKPAPEVAHRSGQSDKRSRSPVRSRSGSRGRRRRSRSRDRERDRDRRRRSKERKDKEREHLKERRRKGLPLLRDRRVSVVSTTVWVGKIHKHTTEKKLRDLLEEFGAVDELFMIPPRGCAYVVYNQRKSAARAVKELQRVSLDNSPLKVAWAPNSGVKDSVVKEFWDVEEGATYVPFDRFPKQGWKSLLRGGAQIDQESVPLELTEVIKAENEVEEEEQKSKEPPVPGPPVAPPFMPPGMMPLPGMPGMPPMPGMMPFMPPPMMAMAAAMQTAVRMAANGPAGAAPSAGGPAPSPGSVNGAAPGPPRMTLPDMSVPPPDFHPPVEKNDADGAEDMHHDQDDDEEDEVQPPPRLMSGGPPRFAGPPGGFPPRGFNFRGGGPPGGNYGRGGMMGPGNRGPGPGFMGRPPRFGGGGRGGFPPFMNRGGRPPRRRGNM